MKISLDKKVLENFPEAKIGWLRANIGGADGAAHVAKLKRELEGHMKDIGLSADTMMLHPDVRRWRETYSKMGVKPSKYRSSIEALLRRLFKGDMWDVSDVVDCYDCVSAMNILPMGAHDMKKLKGGMTLRYVQDGEKFAPLGAGGEIIECAPPQIAYADDEKICCWLWNYRDTRDACVDCETQEAIFIVDCSFDTEWRSVEQGVEALASELRAIGCEIKKHGVVCAANPEAETE
ncbi:MAG: phenylalanine--tRNA ligase beta subunit-related protein [Cloacibacillus sp.]